MNVLQWFTQSCDLSPAYNLWHYLKTTLCKHVKLFPAPEDHTMLIQHKNSIYKNFKQKITFEKAYMAKIADATWFDNVLSIQSNIYTSCLIFLGALYMKSNYFSQ